MSDHPIGERLGCLELLILVAALGLGFIGALWVDYIIQGFEALK